jgi:hypothetical protein
MGRPIPVFAFVFAAFAATSAEGQPADAFAPAESELTASRDGQDLFLATWRSLSRHGAKLQVRVGVVIGEGGAKSTLATREPGAARDPAVEEFWLGEITETGRAFRGVPVETSERPRLLWPRQPIGFELRHIRGWRLDIEDAHAPARGEREPRANLELT